MTYPEAMTTGFWESLALIMYGAFAAYGAYNLLKKLFKRFSAKRRQP